MEGRRGAEVHSMLVNAVWEFDFFPCKDKINSFHFFALATRQNRGGDFRRSIRNALQKVDVKLSYYTLQTPIDPDPDCTHNGCGFDFHLGLMVYFLFTSVKTYCVFELHREMSSNKIIYTSLNLTIFLNSQCNSLF